MKISSLIKKLQAIKKEQGDIQVYFETKSLEEKIAEELEYQDILEDAGDDKFFIDEETSVIDIKLNPEIGTIGFVDTGTTRRAVLIEHNGK